ncbi:hypothetical protein DFH07DRAFT_1060607 [Mycena maculata]|uniref:Uncharacterized protein n=1 Tax=Mycena maculata TaxID=230809 RepID=A0AAD7J529_9AGAR|nr:hypothetical protein DFH07DRAFT_1060607 [Mycena maculata]
MRLRAAIQLRSDCDPYLGPLTLASTVSSSSTSTSSTVSVVSSPTQSSLASSPSSTPKEYSAQTPATLLHELVLDTELNAQAPAETTDHRRIVAACAIPQHLTVLGGGGGEGGGLFTFAQLLGMKGQEGAALCPALKTPGPQRTMPADLVEGLCVWAPSPEARCLLLNSELQIPRPPIPPFPALHHFDTTSQLLPPCFIASAPSAGALKALVCRVFPVQLLDLADSLNSPKMLPIQGVWR